MNWSIYAGD